MVLPKFGFISLAPQQSDSRFSSWWCKSIKGLPKDPKRGLNSLIFLVAWELWKHRNFCVFEGGSPSIQLVLQKVKEEGGLWCAAGAKSLSKLVASGFPS